LGAVCFAQQADNGVATIHVIGDVTHQTGIKVVIEEAGYAMSNEPGCWGKSSTLYWFLSSPGSRQKSSYWQRQNANSVITDCWLKQECLFPQPAEAVPFAHHIKAKTRRR
jgi:hypothetical protein